MQLIWHLGRPRQRVGIDGSGSVILFRTSDTVSRPMNKPPTEFESVDLNVGPHREGLEPIEIGRGVLATHRNARRLLEDAVLLLENRRYAGALATAILANEEAGKFITIGMVGAFEPKLPPLLALAWPSRRIWRHLWRPFGDHVRKNVVTLKTHSLVGSFPDEVREAIKRGHDALAADYSNLRMRCTYVDCMSGDERWSVPELVATPEFAIDVVRAIRKSIGRIPTAAQVASGFATQAPEHFSNPEHLKALHHWSETTEAAELSAVDLEEQREWAIKVDAVLAKIMATTAERASGNC